MKTTEKAIATMRNDLKNVCRAGVCAFALACASDGAAAENPLVYAPDEIIVYAKSLEPRLTEIRRELHQHPEVAWEEVWTTAKIKEILSSLPGVEIKPLAMKTGVVAELKGTKPELGTIRLRCDIDALPVPEEKPDSHAYKSKIPGKSHACGHDGHITINLGAAMFASCALRKDYPCVKPKQ